MTRWVEQTYKYHFNRIPLKDLSVDWTDYMGDYSVVIEVKIAQSSTKSLPTLQQFIDKFNNTSNKG